MYAVVRGRLKREGRGSILRPPCHAYFALFHLKRSKKGSHTLYLVLVLVHLVWKSAQPQKLLPLPFASSSAACFLSGQRIRPTYSRMLLTKISSSSCPLPEAIRPTASFLPAKERKRQHVERERTSKKRQGGGDVHG